MLVNQQTKIAALLMHHPEALDTIISLNPKFEKLRNPLLRKLMAGRVSIGMAAKIGGCTERDFFGALKPLGFETAPEGVKKNSTAGRKPAFLQSLQAEKIVLLDVRPVLENGKDPLKEILSKVKELQPGEALKIINTFEPTPLIAMLQKKGFAAFTEAVSPQQIETWFFRESAEAFNEIPEESQTSSDWSGIMQRFAGNFQQIDVRELEMPQPMIKILERLDDLPEGKALFVIHKRLPVYLLPELAQRQFAYRSRELSEDEVHLIIFRD